MIALELNNIQLAYAGRPVVHDVSFALEAGAIGCLLGPSGSGKSSLLRAIAGFEHPTQGSIRLGERDLVQGKQSLPPHQRGIGMVFQDYALFPHLTLIENIGFGVVKAERAARCAHLIELLELQGLEHRYPHELSGGQQQRVALARALAPRPALILLDEPFSNLDVTLRVSLSRQVRDWLNNENMTALLVTHDQNEAFAMADQIGVLNQGQLQQWNNAYALYHQPANRFVANFIGEGVFLPARVLAPDRLEIELGEIPGNMPVDCCLGCTADVLLRPDDVIHDDNSPITAQVIHKAFRGAEFLYTLKLPSGQNVLSLVPSHHDHPLGSEIGIRLEIDHVIAFRNHELSKG